VNVEYGLRRKDTGERWVGSYNFAPIRSADGTIVGSVVTGRDITKWKNAQAQLEQAQRLARFGSWTWNPNAEQVTWSGYMCELFGRHEAIGFAQVLDLEGLAPRQSEDIGHVLRAGNHLLALVDDVLDLARIDTGQLTMSPEPVTLINEVNETVALLFRSPGIGNEPHRLARLFEPFDRLGAEQTEIEGSGLGLTLSKGLLERMGGTIDVGTQPGTTFAIDLPAAEPPAQASGLTRSAGAPDTLGGERGARQRILYIEDNLSNLTLVTRILARYPEIELIPAMQGTLGLDLAREHRPDLIVLDLHLPDIPGTEVLKRLKADLPTSAIPVIVLTADANKRQEDRVRRLGAVDYITKPLDVVLLLGRTLPGYLGLWHLSHAGRVEWLILACVQVHVDFALVHLMDAGAACRLEVLTENLDPDVPRVAWVRVVPDRDVGALARLDLRRGGDIGGAVALRPIADAVLRPHQVGHKSRAVRAQLLDLAGAVGHCVVVVLVVGAAHCCLGSGEHPFRAGSSCVLAAVRHHRGRWQSRRRGCRQSRRRRRRHSRRRARRQGR